MYEEFIKDKNEAKIHFCEWKPEKPAAVLCLVHGIGEYAARYDHVGAYLKNRNIALIGFDLRGHGLTTGKRGHAAPRDLILDDIDDLIRVAADNFDGLPLYLYGHSMGGNIVLDYREKGRLRNSVKGYVVTAPWLILVKKIPSAMIAAVTAIAAIKPDLIIDTGLQAVNISTVKAEVEKYLHDPLIHHKISVRTAIDGIRAADRLLNSPASAGSPLLLMHGSQDRICSVEGSRRIRDKEDGNCTFVEWEGLYHEIHNERNGSQVLDAIADWIRK